MSYYTIIKIIDLAITRMHNMRLEDPIIRDRIYDKKCMSFFIQIAR